MPAGKDFKADELAGAQLDERLEIRNNLFTTVDCSSEIGLSVDGHSQRKS
jgi:hypothetical protein